MSNTMIAAASSVSPLTKTQFAISGSLSKPLDQNAPRIGIKRSVNLSFGSNRVGHVQLSTTRKPLIVQARVSDSDSSSSISAFVGGFVLGGVIVGALGCVFAPQISKTLARTDRKELMRKLPKFIYDEEKALERTRKILTEKIEQLNAAIDDVSVRLRPEDESSEAGVNSDEVSAV